MLAEFRGAAAHNYDWLKLRYFLHGGASFPADISSSFALVNTWSTDLRYHSGRIEGKDADDFLRSAKAIIVWADGRS